MDEFSEEVHRDKSTIFVTKTFAALHIIRRAWPVGSRQCRCHERSHHAAAYISRNNAPAVCMPPQLAIRDWHSILSNLIGDCRLTPIRSRRSTRAASPICRIVYTTRLRASNSHAVIGLVSAGWNKFNAEQSYCRFFVMSNKPRMTLPASTACQHDGCGLQSEMLRKPLVS